MKSKLPKVLHQVCGKPMLYYILDSIKLIGIKNIIVVTGYKANLVKDYLDDNIKTVRQKELLGTADAVSCAKEAMADFKNDVFILYGDNPLISPRTLDALFKKHKNSGADCTILTATLKNPTGFGRIIRTERGNIKKIVEEQEATLYEKVIDEVNVGAYCLKAEKLFKVLGNLSPHRHKARQEYYLTDVIYEFSKAGLKIESIQTQDEDEIFGITSRNDLIRAQAIIRMQTLDRFTSQGVTITDPNTTYIDSGAEIGQDTIIYPFTIIEENVRIGQRCTLGPFCRIRPGTALGNDVEVGSFVEVVRSRVGNGYQIKHHAYLGDAIVGIKTIGRQNEQRSINI